MTHFRVRAFILLLAFAALGCASSFSDPTAQPPSVQAPGASPAIGLSDEDFAKAKRFREEFGLRSDDAWIRSVAANPASEAARVNIGIPLLPSEYKDITGRVGRFEEVLPLVNAYGRSFPEEWGGGYLDQAAGGVVGALFTNRVDKHRANLEALLLPGGFAVHVRKADWTLRELKILADAVRADAAWFRTVGTELYAVDMIEHENRIRIRFEGPSPDAAADIAEHFRNETWFSTEWAGSGGWNGPRGGLDVLVLSDEGAPLPDMNCHVRPLDPAAAEGDIVSSSGTDGRCILRRLPAVEYQILITAPVGDSAVPVGTVQASIAAGGQQVVHVRAKFPEQP